MILETKRIKLRPVAPYDNVSIFRYRSDSSSNKYQGFVPSVLSEVDEFIAKNATEFDEPESWFQCVIIEKTSGEILGDLGIHFIGDDGYQCELGCTLSKKHQRKGIATEAMRMTIDYLFNKLNKHRISASVDPKNLDSIRLLERLNFRKEAHFKESLFINGKWVDDVIYGLLKSEWDIIEE